jgi:hypothetical protein
MIVIFERWVIAGAEFTKANRTDLPVFRQPL